MTDEFYTGRWEGYYIYGDIYKKQRGIQIHFKVQLTVKDGMVSGLATEEVTEKYMGEPAVVSGFIEGNMISMVKQYPIFYYMDKNGEVQVDRSRTHPPVHYTGYFDAEKQSFSGEWEIDRMVEPDFFGGVSLRIRNGSWRIEKKPAE